MNNSTLYWSKDFTAESKLYINFSEPLKISNALDMEETISKITDAVSTFKIDIIYVDTEADMAILPFIKKKLAEDYNYHNEIKMEVAHK